MCNLPNYSLRLQRVGTHLVAAAAEEHHHLEEQVVPNPGHLTAVRLVAGSIDSMPYNSDNHRKRHKGLDRRNIGHS